LPGGLAYVAAPLGLLALAALAVYALMRKRRGKQ
jgi:MYXO-CTERM domain-containing protein